MVSFLSRNPRPLLILGIRGSELDSASGLESLSGLASDSGSVTERDLAPDSVAVRDSVPDSVAD